MKCKKCNAEWQVDASRSASIKICPFCQEKIAAEKSEEWKYCDNTKELLEYVAAEYGNDALFGRKHFSDHTAPLMPQGQKNLVKQAFECGAVKILQDNMTADQAHKEIAVKQAVGKLIDTYASAKEAAERVVWEFTNAIGWGMAEPTGNPPPTNNRGKTVQSPTLPSDNISKLMILGWQSADVGDWNEARDYFTKARETDPSYSHAFLGLICVDLKCSQEDKLDNIKDPASITAHKYYKLATAAPTVKARVDVYVQTINARIAAEQKAAEEAARRKRVQDDFDDVCKIMYIAKSPDDYRKAITAFGRIDSNYQDINSQIKSKIAECEKKMAQMVAELDKVLAPLREKFAPKAKAANQTKLQEQRKVDKERLDAENARAKADVDTKCSQIKQKFDTDHKAWQEEYNRLKAVYDSEYRKWETEANAVKSQADSRKSQGLCPHCGGTLKGLLSKKCADCGKTPNEPLRIATAPIQSNYPKEPRLPQMPSYTPRTLDESRYVLKEDSSNSAINQRITLAGIEWRILDVQGGKLLLISEKILEKRPYNVEQKGITWENCTLRKYLNGEFLNKLGAIKAAIAETRNNNPNNQWYGTEGGNATNDKVFLLSLDEVCRYFGDSTANLSKKGSTGSDYYIDDKNNAARIANYGSEGASWWWIRSPGGGSDCAAVVDDGGDVSGDGSVRVIGCFVYYDSGGVRPALWLNL